MHTFAGTLFVFPSYSTQNVRDLHCFFFAMLEQLSWNFVDSRCSVSLRDFILCRAILTSSCRTGILSGSLSKFGCLEGCWLSAFNRMLYRIIDHRSNPFHPFVYRTAAFYSVFLRSFHPFHCLPSCTWYLL